MNCLCMLKSKNSSERIKSKYDNEIIFDVTDDIDEIRDLLLNREYDFAILDYNSYFYHDILEILDTKKIETLIFKGQFQEIENVINEKIKNYKELQEQNNENIKVVIKEKEVEKRVEVPVEIEVEKIKYKKVVISVISGKKGAGATHYSLCIAKYLKNFNNENKVAIVEIGDKKLDTNIQDKDISIFSFNNISDYYLNKEIHTYDYIIFDLGYYERDDLNQIFLSSDIKIAIFGAKKWEIGEIQRFLRAIGKLKVLKEINYIYNFVLDEDYKEIQEDMGDLKIHKGVYCLDYRFLNEELNSILFSILKPYLNIYRDEELNINKNKKNIFSFFKRK